MQAVEVFRKSNEDPTMLFWDQKALEMTLKRPNYVSNRGNVGYGHGKRGKEPQIWGRQARSGPQASSNGGDEYALTSDESSPEICLAPHFPKPKSQKVLPFSPFSPCLWAYSTFCMREPTIGHIFHLEAQFCML